MVQILLSFMVINHTFVDHQHHLHEIVVAPFNLTRRPVVSLPRIPGVIPVIVEMERILHVFVHKIQRFKVLLRVQVVETQVPATYRVLWRLKFILHDLPMKILIVGYRICWS